MWRHPPIATQSTSTGAVDVDKRQKKGLSGGIINPGVVLDPQDVKDLQEQLEHDPDFDLSVVGVQNADGDGFINPFTGQSASQGGGGEKKKSEKNPGTP